MIDLKDNEYVRTTDGTLCKVLYKSSSAYTDNDNKPCWIVDDFINTNSELYEEDIKKHSMNIFELLEVNDLIEILLNKNTKRTIIIHIQNIKQIDIIKNTNTEMIISILTHEQWKSGCYRIKRNEE